MVYYVDPWGVVTDSSLPPFQLHDCVEKLRYSGVDDRVRNIVRSCPRHEGRTDCLLSISEVKLTTGPKIIIYTSSTYYPHAFMCKTGGQASTAAFPIECSAPSSSTSINSSK